MASVASQLPNSSTIVRSPALMRLFISPCDQMKEESDKLKHGGEKKSALEVAFGAPRKNLLDDLLSVQEQMAEKCHAFQRVIEQEIVPAIEGMVRHIH